MARTGTIMLLTALDSLKALQETYWKIHFSMSLSGTNRKAIPRHPFPNQPFWSQAHRPKDQFLRLGHLQRSHEWISATLFKLSGNPWTSDCGSFSRIRFFHSRHIRGLGAPMNASLTAIIIVKPPAYFHNYWLKWPLIWFFPCSAIRCISIFGYIVSFPQKKLSPVLLRISMEVALGLNIPEQSLRLFWVPEGAGSKERDPFPWT